VTDPTTESALRIASRCGAAEAECVISNAVAFHVDVANGDIETFSMAESIGGGMRLLTDDRRMGFAYSTDLAGGVEQLVEAAWQNALANDPDEHNVLPETSEVSDDDWSKTDFEAVPVGDKVDFAKHIEQKTLAADPCVKQVFQAGYDDSRSEFTIANSRGLHRRYRNSHCSCWVVAKAARDGVDEEQAWEFDVADSFEALRAGWVAESCARKCVSRLGGKPCATGSMAIVLDNYVATQFLGILGSALMADNVLKGKSFYADCLGDAVASEAVTLIDQNDFDAAPGRVPFDGEGSSAQRTVAIEKGVLRQYLHNAYTAHKMGEDTTANAGRAGFRSPPGAATSSFFVEPGVEGQDGLFRMAGNGLFVMEAMGVHMADPISGDFSFGASGLKIEGGALGGPVRGVTIAGNIRDMMKAIVAVGGDHRFFGGSGASSLLVSDVMISGE
jgi:PmbA protein